MSIVLNLKLNKWHESSRHVRTEAAQNMGRQKNIIGLEIISKCQLEKWVSYVLGNAAAYRSQSLARPVQPYRWFWLIQCVNATTTICECLKRSCFFHLRLHSLPLLVLDQTKSDNFETLKHWLETVERQTAQKLQILSWEDDEESISCEISSY